MPYSKASFKAMLMKQLLFPEQYEQLIYQMLPYPKFSTSFTEGNFCKSQHFHCYSRHTANVTLNLNLFSNNTLCNKLTVCFTLYTARKAQRENRDITLLFL